MNTAQTYFAEKMKSESFRKAYLEEKLKLDLEFMLDELTEEIMQQKPTKELLKSIRRIKLTLEKA